MNGACFANWLPRIDEVRDSIGVGNDGLGVALIGGGLGGVLGSIVAGRVLRPGSILRVLGRSAAGLAIGFPLIALVPNSISLLVLLTFLGFADVLCDTSMNAEAAAIQATSEGSIMHRIHGMWSVGFVAGTLIGWGASVVEVPLTAHLVVVSAALLVVSLRSVAVLRSVPVAAPSAATEPSSFRLTRSIVVILCLALAAAALEVIPNEWSATALRDWLDAGRLKGAGPVVFAASMLIGRFRGDRIIDRIGESRLLLASLGAVAVGVGTLLVAPNAVVALVGFGLWGLGVSVMFPQIYLMAARANPRRPGSGLATMTLAQRGGFMAATASMGALSTGVGFGSAFALIFTVAALLWLGGLLVSQTSSRRSEEARLA